MVLAKLVAASDASSLLREREEALAEALKGQDETALFLLTEENFHFYLTQGSAVRSLGTDVGRAQWIRDLMQLRIDSYDAAISNIHLVRRDEPFVDLDEYWTIHSQRGSRIAKHILTTDSWFMLQGTWKLTGRLSRSYLR